MATVSGPNPYHRKGLERHWRRKLAPERTVVSQVSKQSEGVYWRRSSNVELKNRAQTSCVRD